LIPETLWLAYDVRTPLVAEAERCSPLETGGVLMGYWSSELYEPVVTSIIGPGPKARHLREQFEPDVGFHRAEVARRYEESGRRITYLGDWHTHPGGRAALSDLDVTTLASISVAPQARAPRAVMLILAPGPHWAPAAWRARLMRRPLRKPVLQILPLDIRWFGAPSDAQV
jgi:integrative and conjugative element protein (TIGR02256 family)